MILWICFAFLAAMAVGAVLWPLSRDRARSSGSHDEAYDVRVYRQQLAEIENDRDRGLISADGAEAGRIELARRILSNVAPESVSRSAKDGSTNLETETALVAKSFGLKTLVLVLGALVPLVSVSLYFISGSPGVPSQPHPERVVKTSQQSNVEKLVSQVEARLRDKPQDGRGWDVLAPVYVRLGMYEDALVAYRQAVALLGPSKKRLRGLGQSALRVSGGTVTGEAQATFEQYLVLEPSDIESQLWLARAKEQAGDVEGAIAAFQLMIDGGPKDAKWRPMVEKRIATLRSGSGDFAARAVRPNDGRLSGTGTMADVSTMSEEQKSEFISSMVERLAARLSSDGGTDFDGWAQLVRAYMVLGRVEDAKKALASARAHFGGDNKRSIELDALEKKYRLGS